MSRLKILTTVIVFFCVSHLGFGQYVQEYEMKKNITPLENSLAYIQQLEPLKFEYKTDEYAKLKLPKGQTYGFLTENVQEILPDLVSTETRSYFVGKNNLKRATVKYTDLESLVPILVGAIQEQQQQIDELKRKLEALQAE
ncbi:tail fiber domain-containing protein [Pontibacter sp. SGAir0037]|uniref:tail fiber domain-containing protein n=1 Tax=Pontibacter sp. SGAir0037 TaxID=2571030 RepID=UPI0010CCB964|nr:tail fiber domain-containing protein [Pontibacter sp. SGAir0037]QCR23481.1 DNA topoisomerase IV [Pontibacter sp. SGAir0037]